MTTKTIEALLDFAPSSPRIFSEGRFAAESVRCGAEFRFYEKKPVKGMSQTMVQIVLKRPCPLMWNDEFEFSAKDNPEIRGRGRVLHPFPDRIKRMSVAKKLDFLSGLAAGDAEMLVSLCRMNGVQGLSESEIREFSRLNPARLETIGRLLESGGRVKIVSFSPFLLLTSENFNFLLEKISTLLARYHEKNPREKGVILETLRKRFNVVPRVLQLALKTMAKTGKIREDGSCVSLATHEQILTPQERATLDKLDDMWQKGEFRTISTAEIRERFNLPPRSAERMLEFLLERKKVFQGEDGLVIHAGWLDEIISKIRESKRKELTVGEFKKMTGMSRKYAIPLLELLDRMGVTRRRGPGREIL